MDEEALSKFLSERNIPFRVTHHKAVYTVAESAEAEGTDPSKIVKNILLKDDNGFFLAVLTGDKKFDFVKLRVIRKTKKIRMATPEEVKEKTGVEIGSVNLFSYPEVVVDSAVASLEEINTHPDDNAKTVYFPSKYLKEVVPVIVTADIGKD
jgi:Ala-tRNA(Pro) deacylase